MVRRVALVVGVLLFALGGCGGDDVRTEAHASTTSTLDPGDVCTQHRPAAAEATEPVGAALGMGTAADVVEWSRDAGVDPAPWDAVDPQTPVYSCFYGFLPGTDPDVPLDQIPTTTLRCANGHVAIGYVPSGDPMWLVDADGHSSVDRLADALRDDEALDDPVSSPSCDVTIEEGYGEPDCVRQGGASVCARLGQDLEVTATGLRPGSHLTVTPEGFDEAIEQPVGDDGALTEPVYAAGGPLDTDPPPRTAEFVGTTSDGSRIEGRLHPRR